KPQIPRISQILRELSGDERANLFVRKTPPEFPENSFASLIQSCSSSCSCSNGATGSDGLSRTRNCSGSKRSSGLASIPTMRNEHCFARLNSLQNSNPSQELQF